MKKLLFAGIALVVTGNVMAQDLKSSAVPSVVKTALAKKYPEAAKVSWEKEKGNYEANWGVNPVRTILLCLHPPGHLWKS